MAGLVLLVFGGGIALVVYFLSRPIPPEEWHDFSAGGSNYKVSLPGIPVLNNASMNGVQGAKYILKRPSEGLEFVVAHIDIPTLPPTPATLLLLEQAERDHLLKETKGKLLLEKDIQLGSAPGRELQFEGPDKSIAVARYYLTRHFTGSRLYIVMVGGPRNRIEGPDGKVFFDSFRLIVDPGEVNQPIVMNPLPDQPIKDFGRKPPVNNPRPERPIKNPVPEPPVNNPLPVKPVVREPEPIKKLTFFPFTTYVPKEGKEVISLEGQVKNVVVGGFGRYLILQLAEKRKLAVFDVQAGKLVLEIPLDEAQAHIAAGGQRLVILYPEAKEAHLWNLAKLQKETSFPLPAALTSDRILHVAMGSASAGPLFAYLPKEKRTLALNLDTQETTEVLWTNWANNNGYGPLTMRASPDGTWLVGHGGGWSGCEVTIFNEGRQKAKQILPFRSFDGSFALPSADNKLILTSGGKIFNSSFTEASVPGLEKAFMVPAIEPGYFVTIANQSTREKPILKPDGSLGVYSDAQKLLFYINGLDELKFPGKMSWDKRVHYYPEAGLLVTLDMEKNQLILRSVRKPDSKE